MEHPERRVVVQAVGRRVDMSVGEAWGEGTPSTRIVAIGAVVLEATGLDEAMSSCGTPDG